MGEDYCIEARGLRKAYGASVALDGVDLRIPRGRIVGLIGRNGAGKTTALMALLGLIRCEGELRVLGHDPWHERDALMREAAFVADLAALPRWLRVSDAIDYLHAVHPRFDREKARAYLESSGITGRAKIKSLSRGMAAKVYLSLVLAVDARLLILDEPTLGLDIVERKRFYEALQDWCHEGRTIVVTTHHAEEVQGLLTDVVFIDRGRVVLDRPLGADGEDLAALFMATVA